MLFCAAYDDYVDVFPDLDDAGYYAAGNGACIDLHVNGTATGELSDTDLEGTPLATVLRTAGFPELAEAVERLHELPPLDALATIATATSALFTQR
ncbi:MAG: hypothetical protein DHS20C19_02090 [Acidimicrobiales bacterium]|nr:MAG: hypothetical protein DHS20C19_02090 [Acidimicrobiales bacterium]